MDREKRFRVHLNLNRWRRGVIFMGNAAVFVIAAALLVNLGRSFEPNNGANAADTGSVALTSITTTQVGTGQSGEDATHILNNNVIKYTANYNFTSAGTATVTATLPAGSYWADATISTANGCATGSSLNSDKTVATCILNNQNVGMAAWSLSATVYGANGASVQPVFTDTAGTSNIKPVAVTIVGAPKYNLALKRYDTSYIVAPTAAQQQNGLTGLNINMNWTLYAPVSNRNVLGLEPLQNGAYSFTIDTSVLPDDWSVASCGIGNSSGGLPNAGPSVGTGNAVKNSGTMSCIKTNNDILTITATGAYTGGLDFPMYSAGSTSQFNNQAYYSSGVISVNIPSASLTQDPIVYTFVPSNFAANGMDGAANTGSSSGSAAFSVSRKPQYTILGGFAEKTSGGTLPMWPNQYANNETAPIRLGQEFNAYMYANPPTIPAGDSIHNPSGCYMWDAAVASIMGIGYGYNWSSSTFGGWSNVDIEYGHIDMPTSSGITKCGQAGDGASGWYTDLVEAQAVETVNAVRYVYHGIVMSNPISSGVVSNQNPVKVRLKVNDGATSGEQLYIAKALWTDETPISYNNMWYRVVNATLAHTLAVNNSTANSPTIPAGGTQTVTISPTADGLSGVAAPNVTETVTLSSGLSYVAGSAKYGGVELADPTVDSSGRLVFSLGDITVGAVAKQLTFAVNVSPSTIMPGQGTITALIASSDTTLAAAAPRTINKTFDIAAPATFGVSMNQSAQVLQPGMTQTYDFAIYNTTPSAVTGISEVSVLPYNNDGRGTTGLSSYKVSAISGSTGLTLQYTTDTAVRSNPTAAVTWTTYTTGALPSGITAVRWQMASLASNTTVAAQVVLSDIVADNGAVIGNSIAHLQSSMGELSNIETVSATYKKATIAGTIYRDADLSGALNTGDNGLSGLTVQLKTGDDVVKTTTTDRDGKYVFDTLVNGQYTISLLGAPTINSTDLVTNNDTVSTVAVAAGATVASQNFGFVYPPQAMYDTYGLPAVADVDDAVATELPVLNNDMGPNGQDSQALALDGLVDEADSVTLDDAICQAPTKGVAEIRDGKLYYTPTELVSGTDTFCYIARDSFGHTATARVTVNLIKPDAPVLDMNANNDQATVYQGDGHTFTMHINAPDSWQAKILRKPAAGRAWIDGDDLQYDTHGDDGTIAPVGEYTIPVQVTDEFGQTADAVFTVNVLAKPVDSTPGAPNTGLEFWQSWVAVYVVVTIGLLGLVIVGTWWAHRLAQRALRK